jgi:thymidylate synthase ThyX
MPEVKQNIYLMSMTPNPGKLVEDVISISYQTQRFAVNKHPKMIKFASGRQVPYEQFKLDTEPEIGKTLPGYKKDDNYVAEIIEASHVRAVKFVLAIGHHAILRNCHATFMFENITRKSSLHFLRYQFAATNMQSQKYKDQGDFQYLLPDENEAPPGTRTQLRNYMATLQAMYEDLRKTGIDTEWSRAVYPNNIAQTMTFTTNFEQLRHMCDCLCGDDYVGENQEIMMNVLHIMRKEAPEFFHDFVITEDGRSARRRGSKYARNKFVNWTLDASQKKEFGLEVPKQPPGEETEIP